MSLISYSNISDGTTIDAADVNNPFNTMFNDYNGNIDNSNIAAAAGIAGTKLSNSAITSDKIATDSLTIAHVERAAGQSFATTGPVDATGLTITFTTPASCTKIWLRFEATISSDTAAAGTVLSITDSSNVIQIQRTIITGASNVNALQSINLNRRIAVTASTSYTFKVRVANSTGTSVINQGNNADSPSILWAERA